MKYSANLPIEEQRRLDQLHLGMGSGNLYREGGLASVNPFAAAPTKDMYDSWTPEQKSEWDRYGEFGKLQPIDMLRPPVMLPQPIDMPRPPVMLPLPGQENPYPVDPIRPEVMPRPGIPEVTPRPGPQPMLQPFKPRPLSPMQTPDQLGTLTSLLPRDPNRFAQTMRSDEERLRPPSIQLSRKHGGSLSQTVLNLLRNLS